MKEYNIEYAEDLMTKFVKENICNDIARRIEEKFDCNTVKVEVTLNICSCYNMLNINSIYVSFFIDNDMKFKHYENDYQIYNNDIDWDETNINDVKNCMVDESDIIDAIALDYVFNGGYKNCVSKKVL